MLWVPYAALSSVCFLEDLNLNVRVYLKKKNIDREKTSMAGEMAPRFVRKPRSTEVVEGDSLVVVCEVIGDPKPEVK